MLLELGMGSIVPPADRSLLEGTVHPLHLTVRPGVLGLGQSVPDGMSVTAKIEPMPYKARRGPMTVPGRVTEGAAVVRKDGMDLIGYGSDQVLQESRSRLPVRTPMEFGIGKLAGSVDGHEEVELAFFGTDLCDVDMEVAYGVGLEGFLPWFPICLGQPADAVSLVAPMQAGSS